jgi:hypothetical protein
MLNNLYNTIFILFSSKKFIIYINYFRSMYVDTYVKLLTMKLSSFNHNQEIVSLCSYGCNSVKLTLNHIIIITNSNNIVLKLCFTIQTQFTKFVSEDTNILVSSLLLSPFCSYKMFAQAVRHVLRTSVHTSKRGFMQSLIFAFVLAKGLYMMHHTHIYIMRDPFVRRKIKYE